MRTLLATLAVILVMVALGCRREKPPAPADPHQVFDTQVAMRLMFGNFDPVIKSSLSRVPQGAESNPNFSQVTEIRVRPFFVQDTTEHGARRVFLLAWAKPAGQPFDCDGCIPLISAGVFKVGEHGWEIESVGRAILSYGNFGKPPQGSLVNIGPQRYGFLLKYTDAREKTTTTEALLVPWQGTVVDAMRTVVSDGNPGACGGAYPCYQNQREIKFVPGPDSEYNDIVLTLSGTDMTTTVPYRVHKVSGTQRLRFQNGKYVQMERTGDTIAADPHQ